MSASRRTSRSPVGEANKTTACAEGATSASACARVAAAYCCRRMNNASPVVSHRHAFCRLERCHVAFVLCGACDRGRRYCSDACASEGRAASVKEARQRYARTQNGRQGHARRQRRHRQRMKKSGKSDDHVTDHSRQETAISTGLPPASGERVRPLCATRSPADCVCSRCGLPGKYLRFEHLAAIRRHGSRSTRRLRADAA